MKTMKHGDHLFSSWVHCFSTQSPTSPPHQRIVSLKVYPITMYPRHSIQIVLLTSIMMILSCKADFKLFSPCFNSIHMFSFSRLSAPVADTTHLITAHPLLVSALQHVQLFKLGWHSNIILQHTQIFSAQLRNYWLTHNMCHSLSSFIKTRM